MEDWNNHRCILELIDQDKTTVATCKAKLRMLRRVVKIDIFSDVLKEEVLDEIIARDLAIIPEQKMLWRVHVGWGGCMRCGLCRPKATSLIEGMPSAPYDIRFHADSQRAWLGESVPSIERRCALVTLPVQSGQHLDQVSTPT